MSKRGAGLQISYTINSESSDTDDSTTIPKMPPSKENAKPQPEKKRPGRKKASPENKKVKKATTDAPEETQKASKAPGGTARGARRAGRGRGGKAANDRPALKEIDNAQANTDADELDELDDLGSNEKLTPISMAKKASIAPKEEIKPDKEAEEPEKKKSKRKGPRAKKQVEKHVEEIPETQPETTVQSRLAKAKTSATRKPRPATRDVVPETQPEAMDVDGPQAIDNKQDTQADVPKRVPSHTASTSRQRQTSMAPRRGGSVSDAERGGDATLKRRFNELTNKFDSLDLKYRNLQEVGVQDAQENFDRLKEQSDDRANAADKLISSLRSEIDAQKGSSEEVSGLRGEITNLTSRNKTLANESKTLQSSLQSAQNEIKALQAKLTASRSGSETGSKAPPTNPARGAGLHSGKQNAPIGSADQAREAQKRALKEELYGDLTSLLILGVKRREKEEESVPGKQPQKEEEDVYDCIQTGRNGTLHFHLSVVNPPPQGTSYDDAEFAYTPLLDQKRDADLITLLPDYLAEEICFPRKQTAMFYRRIYECMNKRPEPDMVEQVDVVEGDHDAMDMEG